MVSVTLSNFYVQAGRCLQAPAGAPAPRERRRERLPVAVSPSIPTVSSPPADSGASRADDPHFPSFIHNKHPDDESW
jgi:hypothetical protein